MIEYIEYIECDEVADGLPTTGVRTWEDACAVVRAHMGAPADIGYQVFDNVAESLLIRAVWSWDEVTRVEFEDFRCRRGTRRR